MTKVMTVANQKGGVGKTITAINLASFLTILGKNVLLLDMDPQGHVGVGLGIDIEDEDYVTTYDLLIDKNKKLEDCITEIDIEDKTLDLVISNVKLSFAEKELEKLYRSPIQILQKKLRDTIKSKEYDFIIIDSPPSLGNLAINAFLTSDTIIIPVSTSFFSLHGVEKIAETLQDIMEELEIQFDIYGLLTRYKRNQKISNSVHKTMKEFFSNKLFRTIIRENIDLEKAIGEGLPICEYKKSANGYLDYKRLAMEVMSYGR